MKRITIEKNEEIAEVIDRILEGSDDEVTLTVPKGSALGKSISNFHLLKREADSAGKLVTVESVDDHILAFAEQSGLPSGHGFWKRPRVTTGLSDIVPRSELPHGEEDETVRKHASRKRKQEESVRLTVREETEEEEPTAEEEEEHPEEKSFFGDNRFFKERSAREDDDEEEGDRHGSRKLFVGVAVIAVLAVIFFGVTWLWGHAAITIGFKKTPWEYKNNFVAAQSASKIDPIGNVIPAQIFTTQKNVTQPFPASGKSNVSQKAQGTLTIYNAYSSAPQDLVATTRFVTPDGKIFRLVNNVTVPGAQIVNGKVTPSSIAVPVVADQPGPLYNLGPVEKLTIPGFQGSPKYDAFYGAIAGTTSGGFVGQRAVPTAADIAFAKTKVTAVLQTALQGNLSATYPRNFKILDGATSIQITKLTVGTSTDQAGNFNIFGEATLQAIGFDETLLKSYLLGLAQSEEASSTFSVLNVDYSNVQANFSKGQVAFALAAQGSLEPLFSPGDFAQSLIGKSLGDTRAAIAALPELADGKISVWPMWLWRMPSDEKKIEVTAD